MRIIGGQFKGRQILPDRRLSLRPTTDFAKEGLFNILSGRYDMENIRALDLFAGTGSIAYEFVSRGAIDVHCVDIHPKHAAFIRSTAKQSGFNNIRVVRDDVFHFLSICKATYDIVFADPPYETDNIATLPDAVLQADILAANGTLIVEHSRRTDFSAHPLLTEQRHYGNVRFSFFKPPASCIFTPPSTGL
ncbi:MAG: RsmD family RNA methyltransferase [Bacteroidales bacterium]|jgi:16S rRNA (guanine(966)-N(2))-methyltransferase RsmD|nr:RsmD family RNA methyltransferase [Bacteroidales bacterium]